MRNRALISWWALDLAGDAVEIIERDNKHFVKINNYDQLRKVFGEELAEIQRIKSEGDFEAARNLVEKYAVKIQPDLHKEILDRYEKLNIAPYKGFINPWMKPVFDEMGNIKDIELDYSETFEHQNLRYSDEYSTL